MTGQVRLGPRFGECTPKSSVKEFSTRRILQPLRAWGLLLLVVGSLGLPALSQQMTEPPDAPSFNKKLFIVELSTYTAVNVLDGITTAQNVKKGYVEGNFPAGSSYLLGRRPSAARYAVTMGLIEVGVSVASYHLQHSRTKWMRMAGHALMIQAAFGHADGSIQNIRLAASE
jgi:hypothetical protein